MLKTRKSREDFVFRAFSGFMIVVFFGFVGIFGSIVYDENQNTMGWRGAFTAWGFTLGFLAVIGLIYGIVWAVNKWIEAGK